MVVREHLDLRKQCFKYIPFLIHCPHTISAIVEVVACDLMKDTRSVAMPQY